MPAALNITTLSPATLLQDAPLLDRDRYLAAPDIVARRLLGKLLVRQMDGNLLAGRIVETEAYFGKDDPAAHSFAGRTPRTEVIFGPPGHAYVYFIYGMYNCLNVTCEPEGQAGCVLIRALEPVAGLDFMASHRRLAAGLKPALLTGGPGRLCQAMGITRAAHNGMDLISPLSELQIREPASSDCDLEEIAVTPRIGITKAAELPLRFMLAGNACVSRGKFWKGPL
jgi:DNA-3-methyladenine glycosylase